MEWELILKNFPDDAESIQQARAIWQRVTDHMDRLHIPHLAVPLKAESMSSCIPVDMLADICREVWGEIIPEHTPFDFHQFLESSNSDPDMPGVSPEYRNALQVLLRAVITTYFRLLREVNESLIDRETGDGSCPFCHTFPRIGFDTDSSRILICPLCSCQWSFPRIRCTVCGNRDHTTLGYFESEELSGVRVYYCTECTHYVKIVDTRVRPVRDAETEDVLTLALDDMARQEGFLES